MRRFDLGKFRQGRKTRERWAEHFVGVDTTPIRAIELGKGERGAQLEAAGFLTSRGRDRGEESLFGARETRWVLLEQDFATRAVELRVEPVLPAPPGFQGSKPEGRQRSGMVTRLGFGV